MFHPASHAIAHQGTHHATLELPKLFAIPPRNPTQLQSDQQGHHQQHCQPTAFYPAEGAAGAVALGRYWGWRMMTHRPRQVEASILSPGEDQGQPARRRNIQAPLGSERRRR